MKAKCNGVITLFMLFVMQFIFAQDGSISGVVTDQSGLPLPGVNVFIKGTQTGTQTDFDGKFTIPATQGQVLVFTFIGMETREVPASPNMTVQLTDNAVQLEGVVVTALGIKREKKALGYSTTLIKSEQITNVVNTNPFESLSGKVAGVDISAPMQPGASSKIIVRGFNSITGDNSPLIVVDGTPMNTGQTGSVSFTRSYDAGSGLTDIDPNNVESINFLKGAAATALYGSRGANGVILITTKRGKNQNKINVDITTTVELNEVARVPHLQNKFGQGWNGLGYSPLPDGLGPSNENGSWGPAFNGEIRPWGTVYNNSQQIKPYVALEDNVRDFYDIGIFTTNTVTLSGGSDVADFSLTFSNQDSDGIIPTDADRFRKRSLGLNGGLKSDKLIMRASINYTNREQNIVNTGQGDDAGEGSTLSQELLQIPRDVSVVDLADYINNPFNTPSYFFTPYSANPYFTINENETKLTSNNIFGNVNVTYNITPSISAAWQIGGNYRMQRVKSHGAIVNYEENSPQYLAQANPVVGGVTESRIERALFDTFFNLSWDKKLSDDFNLNLLAGVAFRQDYGNSLSARITNLDVPNYYELTNSAIRPTIAQNDSMERTFGYYAQAELSYLDRYFLTLSAREDRSSTLPVNNSSYFYPSASLSAVVINENQNFLKLRAGIAGVGGGTTPYQTSSSFVAGSALANFGLIMAPLGGINYYELDALLGNENLKPEMTYETEVGAEGAFFGNRLTFDVSLYWSKTTDLIAQVPLDPSTGFSRQSANIGDLENRGIELTLGLTPVKTEDFRWDINYTFSKNENEVTKLAGGVDKIQLASVYGVTFVAMQGQPIGVFQALVAQTTPDGQIIVDPNTGFAEVTQDPQTIGNAQRDFIMGLQNTIRWKNLSLNFAFDWKQGGEMYSYTNRLSNFTGNSIESTYNDRNPFIIPNSVNAVHDGGGNVIGYVENTTPVTFEYVTNYWGNTSNNPAIERRHVIDKTFIRLRDLNLTYAFGEKVTDKLGLTGLSISVYGRNLFMWTPAENPYVDPETTTLGTDVLSELGEFGTNPSQRSYGAMLKLSF